MGNSAQQRREALRAALQDRILVLDGAMGTMLQQRRLTAEDFGGAALEGCNENLAMTRPDVLLAIHGEYFAAGADLVETNTFGSTAVVLAEYGLEQQAEAITRRAELIAGPDAAEEVKQQLKRKMDLWQKRAQRTAQGNQLGYETKKDGVTVGLLRKPNA